MESWVVFEFGAQYQNVVIYGLAIVALAFAPAKWFTEASRGTGSEEPTVGLPHGRNAARRIDLSTRWGRSRPGRPRRPLSADPRGSSQKTFILDLGGQVARVRRRPPRSDHALRLDRTDLAGQAAFVGVGGIHHRDRRPLGRGRASRGGGSPACARGVGAVIGVCALAGLVVGLPFRSHLRLGSRSSSPSARRTAPPGFSRPTALHRRRRQASSSRRLGRCGSTTTSATATSSGCRSSALHLTARGQFCAAPRRPVDAGDQPQRPARRVGRRARWRGYKLLAFVLSSVLAGIGGWLYAHDLSGAAGYFDTLDRSSCVVRHPDRGLGTLLGAWIGARHVISALAGDPAASAVAATRTRG